MPSLPQDIGQVGICCRVPDRATEADVSRWQGEATSRSVAVTWAVSADDLPVWLASSGDGRTLAVRVGDEAGEGRLERPEIRRALRNACGRVSAAVIDGDRAIDHRGLFIEGGIDVVAAPQLHAVDRPSRRPPPAGWDCRCQVWGLWEAGFTAPRRRLFGLVEDNRPRRGGLTLLETGCRPGDRLDVGLARLRQTLALVQPSLHNHTVRTSLLSELPTLLPGGHASADRGSILAAA